MDDDTIQPAAPAPVGDHGDGIEGDEPAPSSGPRRSLPILIMRSVGLVVGGLLLLVTVLAIWPASTSGLGAEPEPTASHEEAVARFAEVTVGEPATVFEPCESRLLDHGEATEVVVVLFHGLTLNCPEQFVEFGTELFDAGANVLILRAPRHGLANVAGDGIGGVSNVDGLEADELANFADTAIDIAAGLGDEVRVLGLSMGGVLATWTAQERVDVDRVGRGGAGDVDPAGTWLPHDRIRQPLRQVARLLPDLPGESNLDHVYAGESTKGLVATFLLARFVEESAGERGPAAGEVVVVVNPDDNQVDRGDVTSFAVLMGTGGRACRVAAVERTAARRDRPRSARRRHRPGVADRHRPARRRSLTSSVVRPPR